MTSQKQIDLEKVVNPKGKQKGFTIKEEVENRTDKVRHIIALSAIGFYLLATMYLLYMSFNGKCENCDLTVYYAFSSVVAMIIGFYFGQKTSIS